MWSRILRFWSMASNRRLSAEGMDDRTLRFTMTPDLTTRPKACDFDAYYRFVDTLTGLDTTDGLVQAAIAISMHALDDIAPAIVHEQIAMLAARVRAGLHSTSSMAALAHLHQVLFEEEGFRGSDSPAHLARNSYLPLVWVTKTATPLVLALLYKAVGEQVGLEIDGLGSPDRFLVRVQTEEGPMILDPARGGALLTQDEALRRLETAGSLAISRSGATLASATHVDWLAGILANLIHFFRSDERHADLAAMLELREALDQLRD